MSLWAEFNWFSSSDYG